MYFTYLFSQATVTATPIIRVSLPASSASASTNIKLNPTPGTAVQKPPTATGTTIFTPSCTTGTTIIKPAGVIGTAIRKPSSTIVIKASQMTPNSSTSGTFNQRTNSVTATTVINTSAVKVLLTSAASIIDPNNNNKTKKMIHTLTPGQDVD